MAAKKKQKKAVRKVIKALKKPSKPTKVVEDEEEEGGHEVKKPTPGVYVYKPLKSKIVECECGNKYIVTRPKQRTCLDCVKEQMLAAR